MNNIIIMASRHDGDDRANGSGKGDAGQAKRGTVKLRGWAWRGLDDEVKKIIAVVGLRDIYQG